VGAGAGITTVQLRTGESGAARVLVKGRGEHLRLPALPLHQDGHVTVQLVGPNACWEARYGTNVRNDGVEFRARAD
jgi:hypothetical protein